MTADNLSIDTEHGEIGLDEWQALLERFPEFADRAIASALKSEGWRLQHEIKRSIQIGGSDLGWPKLNPHTGVWNRAQYGRRIKNYRLSRKGVRRGDPARRSYRSMILSTKTLPLSKFVGATRYVYDRSIKTVTIGFLKSNMRNLAWKQAVGFRTPLTPRLRRKAFAIGAPLKKETTALVVPPRPVVGPVFHREEANIVKNVQFTALDRIVKYTAGRYKFEDAGKAPA